MSSENTPAKKTHVHPAPHAIKQERQLRSAARLYAVQALFQMESSKQTIDDICQEFEDHRFGADYEEGTFVTGDSAYFRKLVSQAVDFQSKIDQMTDRALVSKWPIARIDPVLRALFRAAGAEMTLDQTPPKLIITEFLHVTSAFFPEGREQRFVNAVLDHMAREAQPGAF